MDTINCQTLKKRTRRVIMKPLPPKCQSNYISKLTENVKRWPRAESIEFVKIWRILGHNLFNGENENHKYMWKLEYPEFIISPS
jgi:hypothetical protein